MPVVQHDRRSSPEGNEGQEGVVATMTRGMPLPRLPAAAGLLEVLLMYGYRYLAG